MTRTATSGNRLLDCVSADERDEIVRLCEHVSLAHGEEVYAQDSRLAHVYFPVSAVCSSVVHMETGQIVETATIGNEGLVGAQAYLGMDESLYATHVQVAGDALRLRAAALRSMARRCPELDRVVRSYLMYALRYANQTVACNALHSVEERACRWLLMTHDRVGSDAFPLTHEFFAEMLGIHRQTVSAVASELQRAGWIQYRRGSVRIMNRGALEGASCECYAVTSNLFHHLVGC